MIENELGLTAAQQFNPILGQQAGVIVSLWGLIATAYFWLLDFIPLALATLLTSFDLVPLGVFTLASVHEVIAVASRVFGGALIVAAPVVAVGFAVNLALAFAAKSIQQFNVFSEGFAIRLAAVGAGLLGLLPVLLLALRSVLEDALPSAARWLGSISSS
jgi:flagellar biosynthetic protein FliR